MKKNYLTPSNWVDEGNCYYDDSGILLDSLEIFQIIKDNKPEEEENGSNNDIITYNSKNQEN